MRVYTVIIEDYKNKTTKLVECEYHVNKNNSLEIMKKYIDNYIDSKEGVYDRYIYRKPSSLKSRTYNHIPYGYVVLRKNEGNLDKFYVHLKEKDDGYLYNSYKIIPVFSIQIMEFEMDNVFEYNLNLGDEFEYKDKFNMVLDELINN